MDTFEIDVDDMMLENNIELRDLTPEAIKDMHEVKRQQLDEFYYIKQTSVNMRTLLAHGAYFTEEEGELFYRKLLRLNLTDYDDLYLCLRMIESRFVYSELSKCLEDVEMIFRTQRTSISLSIMMAIKLPEVIAKIISDHLDPLEKNYLMIDDVEEIMTQARPPCTDTITAVLKRGLFRQASEESKNEIAPQKSLIRAYMSSGCRIC